MKAAWTILLILFSFFAIWARAQTPTTWQEAIPGIQVADDLDLSAFKALQSRFETANTVTQDDLALFELKPCRSHMLPLQASVPPQLLRFHLRADRPRPVGSLANESKTHPLKFIFKIESRLEVGRVLGFLECDRQELRQDQVDRLIRDRLSLDLQLGPFWRHLTSKWAEFHIIIPDQNFMPEVFPRDEIHGCSTSLENPEMIIHCRSDFIEYCKDRPCVNLASVQELRGKLLESLQKQTTAAQAGIHFLFLVPTTLGNLLFGRIWIQDQATEQVMGKTIVKGSDVMSGRLDGYFGHGFRVSVNYKQEGIRIDMSKAQDIEATLYPGKEIEIHEKSLYQTIEPYLTEQNLR